MSIRPGELVIDDSNFQEWLQPNQPDQGFGLVPRNWDQVPYGSMRAIVPFNIPVIPRVEWPSLIKDMTQSQSLLSNVRATANNGKMMDSLNQGQSNFCWAYSTTGGVMLARAVNNQPFEILNAHSLGCKIMNFQNKGGWSPLSAEYAAEHGICTMTDWKYQSFSRSNDTPAAWLRAKGYIVTDAFMDMHNPAYDRNLTFDQFFTCLLLRIPCTMDLNWWRHSVLGMDPIEADSSLKLSDINRWAVRPLNSWGNSYGTNGEFVLRGSKCVPNGGVAISGVWQAA